jgi:hypothetical protein
VHAWRPGVAITLSCGRTQLSCVCAGISALFLAHSHNRCKGDVGHTPQHQTAKASWGFYMCASAPCLCVRWQCCRLGWHAGRAVGVHGGGTCARGAVCCKGGVCSCRCMAYTTRHGLVFLARPRPVQRMCSTGFLPAVRCASIQNCIWRWIAPPVGNTGAPPRS